MAKHKVLWQWEAEFEFDSDETDPAAVAADFMNATSEGLDFINHSETWDFVVTEVDGEHVHNWVGSYRPDEEFCTHGLHYREKPTQTVYLPGDNPRDAL